MNGSFLCSVAMAQHVVVLRSVVTAPWRALNAAWTIQIFYELSFCHCCWCCWESLLVECWTCDQKVENSNPNRSIGRIFFSRVNFVYWLFFSVCSTPVLPQWHIKDSSHWHIKDSSHSAKSAGGRLHLNMHTTLTLYISMHEPGYPPDLRVNVLCVVK